MRKQDLSTLFRGAAGRWPASARLSAIGPRGEGAAAPPAAGGAGDPGAAPTVDLANPAVQAAIQAAVTKAMGTAQADWEAEKGRIIANRDAILGEKKAWDALGVKPEEAAARIRRAEELESAARAKEVGAEPDKFSAAVEAAAQVKYKAKEAELSGLMKQDKDRIAELTTENERLARAEARTFVAYQLALASIPQDLRTVQEGAHDILIDRIAEITTRQKVDGIGEVARFKVGGALVPGGGPDGLMTMAELVALSRQGKGPLPNLGFCFVSQGQGSATVTPTTVPAPGGNWHEMTPDQRAEYTKKHGKDAAIQLMETSPRKAAAA